jgi:hypothetical protein
VLGHTMVSQNELVFDRCKQNLIYMYYSGTHYWLTTMHIFPLFKKAMYVTSRQRAYPVQDEMTHWF